MAWKPRKPNVVLSRRWDHIEEASMNAFSLLLLAAMGTGVCTAQGARDYSAILGAARTAWPGDQTIGIVCSYGDCGELIQGLAKQLPKGTLIKVADVRHANNLGRGCSALRAYNPTFMLLLREDRLFRDGGFYASDLIRTMNQARIPTLATTPRALLQGALAVAGPMTGHEVMVNPALAREGTVGPVEWRQINGTKTRAQGAGHQISPGGAVVTLVASF